MRKRSLRIKVKSLYIIEFLISIFAYTYFNPSHSEPSTTRDCYLPDFIDFSSNVDNVQLKMFVLSKVKRTLNNHSIFFLILTSGDIETNPGPIKDPCSICLKTVTSRHRAVSCDSCNLWSHIKCTHMSLNEYKSLQLKNSFNFMCAKCLQCVLPFYMKDCIVNEENIDDVPFDENEFNNFDISNLKGLKIGHININSLLNKLDYVKLMIKKFDSLAVSETKLDNDITDAELCITECNLVRLDRNCYGGGVLFYCHEKYSMTHESKFHNDEFESLWIKVNGKNSRPFLFQSHINLLLREILLSIPECVII